MTYPVQKTHQPVKHPWLNCNDDAPRFNDFGLKSDLCGFR